MQEPKANGAPSERVAHNGNHGTLYRMVPGMRRAPSQWLVVGAVMLSFSTSLMRLALVWGAVVATTAVAAFALFVHGWLARRRMASDPGLTLAEDSLLCRGVGGVCELRWDEIESYELYGGPSYVVFRLRAGRAIAVPLAHFELYETIVRDLKAKLGPPARMTLGDFWLLLGLPFVVAAAVLALFSSWQPLLAGGLIGVYTGPAWVACLSRVQYRTARMLVVLLAGVLLVAGVAVLYFAAGLSGRRLVLWCLTGIMAWYGAFCFARLLTCES